MQTSLKIQVPTINEKPEDYLKLSKLWEKVIDENVLNLTLNFSYCNFLQSHGVAFLAGLVTLVKSRGGTVEIDLDSIREKVRANLNQNNFLAFCGMDTIPRSGNSVPLRHDYEAVNNLDFLNYLKQKWIRKYWMNCSDNLLSAISNAVLELHLNASEHSHSSIGAFTCGQRYPNMNKLQLTLVDFGVGIPYNVREYFNVQAIPAQAALSWAFQRGHSTRRIHIPQGLGLFGLSDFVKKNSGDIFICSEGCYGVINKNGSSFKAEPDISFKGTIVTITLNCDEQFYTLEEEEQEEDIPF